MLGTDMWGYGEVWAGERAADAGNERERSTVDLTGFDVEALDGSIGKVDDASYEAGRGSVVVDTGPWIFGKKVLLPAGVIDRIDAENEKVYVHRTKDEIKGAPEYDEMRSNDDTYRSELGSYYGEGGAGYRDRPPW